MLYTSNFVATATTVARDVWEITAPTDAVVIVHGWELHQTSDTKDAEEEILEITTERQTSAGTSGSTGATVVTAPIEYGASTAGSSVEGFNSTQATNNLTVLARYGWNVRIPFLWIYAPEVRPIVSPGFRFLIKMPAPADSLTVGSTIWFEEIGG